MDGKPRAADGPVLADYLHTLNVCRRALPGDAHPEHFQRLREIEAMVRRHFADPSPGETRAGP